MAMTRLLVKTTWSRIALKLAKISSPSTSIGSTSVCPTDLSTSLSLTNSAFVCEHESALDVTDGPPTRASPANTGDRGGPSWPPSPDYGDGGETGGSVGAKSAVSTVSTHAMRSASVPCGRGMLSAFAAVNSRAPG